MSSEYQAVKLTPEAASLLRQASYRLTGELNRKITLSEAVTILCRNQPDREHATASGKEQ